MVQLLKIVVEIDSQRPKVKIWFPGRIEKVRDNIINQEFKDAAAPIALGTAEDPARFESFDSLDSTLDDERSKRGRNVWRSRRVRVFCLDWNGF